MSNQFHIPFSLYLISLYLMHHRPRNVYVNVDAVKLQIAMVSYMSDRKLADNSLGG